MGRKQRWAEKEVQLRNSIGALRIQMNELASMNVDLTMARNTATTALEEALRCRDALHGCLDEIEEKCRAAVDGCEPRP